MTRARVVVHVILCTTAHGCRDRHSSSGEGLLAVAGYGTAAFDARRCTYISLSVRVAVVSILCAQTESETHVCAIYMHLRAVVADTRVSLTHHLSFHVLHVS